MGNTSAKCQFINNCNVNISQSDMKLNHTVCIRHRCMVCNKLPIIPNYKYCKEHKCIESLCVNPSIDGMKTCHSHRCYHQDCVDINTTSRSKCLYHTCQNIACYEPVVDKKYAKLCKIHGCNKCGIVEISGYFSICEKCRCTNSNCANPKEDNYKYCIDCKCPIINCIELKNGTACNSHKCQSLDCNNIVSCNKHNIPYYICELHKCPVCNIYKPTDKIHYKCVCVVSDCLNYRLNNTSHLACQKHTCNNSNCTLPTSYDLCNHRHMGSTYIKEYMIDFVNYYYKDTIMDPKLIKLSDNNDINISFNPQYNIEPSAPPAYTINDNTVLK